MNKYALVVGVSTYDDPDISDLRCAAADAREIGKALREICGFSEVHELVTGGEREPLNVHIFDLLCSLAPTLTPDDMFLFYFAGHGIVTDSGTHLLTRNSRIQMPELFSLSWQTLSSCLSNISCADRVLIMDACRNDPRQGRGEEDNLMTERFSRDIMAIAETKVEEVTPATWVLFSCRTGERAYEWPEKGHGAFTHYLLEGLRGKAVDAQGRITVGSLGRYAEERVPQWAKKTRKPLLQRPWGERKGSMREIVLSAQVVATPRVQTVDEPTLEVHASESDEPGRADWYYVHPAVKREWVERCGDTVTIQLADNGKRTEISSEKVIEEGIVRGIFYDKGKPVLKTSIEALIAGGEMNLLPLLLEDHQMNVGALRITKLLVDGKKEKAWYEFVKAMTNETPTTASVLIQHIGLGDRGGAEKALNIIEETADSCRRWNDTAKLWKILLDDIDTATCCLLAAEGKAKTVDEWRSCAANWKGLLNSNGTALRCLREAESKATNSSDWIACAESWKKLIDNDTETNRLMKKAEGASNCSSHWVNCAKCWKEVFGVIPEAVRCLKEAEHLAKNPQDWRKCAKSWKEFFDDDAEAEKCHREAEICKSEAEKERLKKKEDKNKYSFHWIDCARNWKERFGNNTEAVRCLRNAELAADSPRDWRTCANGWERILENYLEAKKCIQKANKMNTAREKRRK